MKKMFFLYRALCLGVGGLMLTSCQNSVQFGVEPQQDAFRQQIAYNNKVDFLWIIDNSTSMQPKQQKLNQQVPDLVSVLNRLKLDYHMAFISTDMRPRDLDREGNGGKFLGAPKYLDGESLDLIEQIQSRIYQAEGSSLEQGLLSMEQVMNSSYLQGEGVDFFREDALLVINVLSDEDDKSGQSASYYRDFLNRLKPAGAGQGGGWVLNYIGVIDLSGTCTASGYPDPGFVFMDLASWSGGKTENICSNSLVEAVKSIRARIEQILTDYPLQSRPKESTIHVFVNGAEIPKNGANGWLYISDLNVIRFFGSAVPPADAQIVVNYDPY